MELAKYRFTLDGVHIDDPEGWNDIEITIERERDISGLIVMNTNEFIFKGNGYNLLIGKHNGNYLSRVEAVIEELSGQNYVQLFKGVIFLSEIEFNLDQKTAKATIEDESFQANIQNNKDIEIMINNGQSKNGVTLIDITRYGLDFFNTTTGTYFGSTLTKAFRVKDALSYLVRYMSDDRIKGIVSDYLDDTANFETGLLYILRGEQVRTRDGGALDMPNVTFRKLMHFLNSNFFLEFGFETNTNNEPVMRVEPQEYFFTNTANLNITNIKDLKQSVDTNKLFAALKLGNQKWTTGNYSTEGWIDVFKERQYTLKGLGNIATIKDMTFDYITDTNVIQDIVMNANDDYDDDMFIVVGNTAGTQALQFSLPNFHYNSPLTNQQTLDRLEAAFGGDIIKHLPGGTARAVVENIPFLYNCDPVNDNTVVCSGYIMDFFFTEIADWGNNYANYEYVCPATAKYVVNMRTIAQMTFKASTDSSIELRVLHKNSSGNLIQTYTKTFSSANGDYPSHVGGVAYDIDVYTSFLIQCNAGEILRPGITYAVVASHYGTHSFKHLDHKKGEFKVDTQNDYPVFSFDASAYRARLLRFKKNLSLPDFQTLRNAPFGIINVSETTDKLKRAWIKRLSYKRETSECNFELLM